MVLELKEKLAVITGASDVRQAIRRFGSVEELEDFCFFVCSPRALISVGSAGHVDFGILKTV